MEAPQIQKRASKVIKVLYHGHNWSVYPMMSRGRDIFRVFHRVDGKRVAKTFMTLAKAKIDAKNILKELYGKADSKIHLTEDDKRDWQAATRIRHQGGIRSSLETIVRHYADLIKVVGDESLLTDVVRKHAETASKATAPIGLSALRDLYVAALKKQERSDRYARSPSFAHRATGKVRWR